MRVDNVMEPIARLVKRAFTGHSWPASRGLPRGSQARLSQDHGRCGHAIT